MREGDRKGKADKQERKSSDGDNGGTDNAEHRGEMQEGCWQIEERWERGSEDRVQCGLGVAVVAGGSVPRWDNPKLGSVAVAPLPTPKTPSGAVGGWALKAVGLRLPHHTKPFCRIFSPSRSPRLPAMPRGFPAAQQNKRRRFLLSRLLLGRVSAALRHLGLLPSIHNFLPVPVVRE